MRILMCSLLSAFIVTGGASLAQPIERTELPEIKDLRLQRSSYPATMTADCSYVDETFDMDCSFFVSRVTAKKSDGRVNDMLMRMYANRTADEWKNHPICTAPEVKDIDRHIRVLQVQKKIGKREEDMIRRTNAPAKTFCDDPTLANYKAYLENLADDASCSLSTTAERVKMRYKEDRESWSGFFTPKSDRQPVTEYRIKLDSVTGQVGKRLIFMVTQIIRPKGGGRPSQLVYRATRAGQKHFCGYVEW